MKRAERDAPWKEFLEHFLPAVLAICFPDIARQIDWNASFKFLDKELQEIIRGSRRGRLFVDKLVEVVLIGGSPLKIYLHIEVQHTRDGQLELRVFRYHYRLAEKYGPNVVTLVILADQDGNWRPCKYEHELLNCWVLFEFPTCKLKDLAADLEKLLSHPIPAALVIASDWISQTQKNPDKQLEWKMKVMERLYEKGLKKEEVLGIFKLADWLLPLEKPQREVFRERMIEMELKKNMPYVNTIQEMSLKEGRREGRREGRDEGRVEAMRLAIKEALEGRFEVHDKAVNAALEGISQFEELNKVFKLAVTVKDFSEFKRKFLP